MSLRQHWETLKACSAPNLLRRRHWHPRISRWTIHDQNPDLYTIVQLTSSALDRTITQCHTTHHDPWHGPVSSVTAILYAVHLQPFIPHHHSIPAHHHPITPAPAHFVAVLPFRICSHGIVAVPEEIHEALTDMRLTIRALQDTQKPVRDVQDVEAGGVSREMAGIHALSARLVVFGTVRFSLISENRFRRIGVPEYLQKVKLAFEVQRPGKTERCTLVMVLVDLEQCGLMPHVKVEWFASEYEPRIVSIEWCKLEEYVDSVTGADSLLWDLLISVNDYELPDSYGFLLDLTKVHLETGMLSQYHAVEPKRLGSAIRDVFAVKRAALRGNDPAEEEKDQDAVLAAALQYALGLAINGVDPDYPRKVVGPGWGFHLLNQGGGRLVPFRRLVKSVSSAGYRVRKLSIWMWIAVGLGCILPIAYIVIRSATADVAFEELINTAISLVALYIALASPTLFQTVYRGERLTDVLSNLRNIDSQEEFDDREVSGQHTDILEVIRLARRPPKFFGGQNMSYLRQSRPEGLLDAKQPILFPNLELAGYSLFEDKGGNLFMLDRWTNVFEVVIGRKTSPGSQLTSGSPVAQSNVVPEEQEQPQSSHSSTVLSSLLMRRQTAAKRVISGVGTGESSPPGDGKTALVSGTPEVEMNPVPGQAQDASESLTNHMSKSTHTGTSSASERVSEHSDNVMSVTHDSSPVQPAIRPAERAPGLEQPTVRSRRARSSTSGQLRYMGTGMRDNPYRAESDCENLLNESDTFGMGIYCHPVKPQTVRLKVNHGRGSFSVKYVSTDGTTVNRDITRVLPYRARKRQVESHDWRQASTESWEVISNKSLLAMPVGMNIRDSVVGF